MSYEDFEDDIYALFHQVMRFHFLRSHELLEQIGVYPGQPPLLFALGHHDGLSQKDLANRLNVRPATITVMIKRMEKAGYIKRVQDEIDQRISRVYLTDSGRKLMKEVKQTIKKINYECFTGLTEEEEAFLKTIFIKMRNNLYADKKAHLRNCKTGDEKHC